MPFAVLQRRIGQALFAQRRSTAAQRPRHTPLLVILAILAGCASPSIGDRSLADVTDTPAYPTAISATDAAWRTTSRPAVAPASATAELPAPAPKQTSNSKSQVAHAVDAPPAAAPAAIDVAPAARPLHVPQAPIPLTDRDRLRIATPRSPEPGTPPVQLVNVAANDAIPAEASPLAPPVHQTAAAAPASSQPAIANSLLPMSALQRPITQTALAIAPQLTATVQPTAMTLPAPQVAAPTLPMSLPGQLLPTQPPPNGAFGPAQQLASQVAAASANIAALTADPVIAPAVATQAIAAESPSAAATSPAAASAATATPLAAEMPITINDQLARLIESLQTELAARREAKAPAADIARLELQLRILYVVAQRPTDAAEAIEALSPPERESIKHLLFGLSSWMTEEAAGRGPHRNAKIARSLRDATNELAAGSRLDVRNMTFCEKVEYFGWYTEFPRAEFTAKQQVILYVEVENFAAEQKGPQAFETELQGNYQIFDASNALVAERTLPLDRETCRNLRRDYFLAYRIYMPDQIAAGAYRLELTLEDVKARGEFQGRKLGQATIDFTIR